MRASLLLALLAAGCGHATAVDVTVTFDGSHSFNQLDVTVTANGNPLKTNVTVSAGGRAIRSGDDFVVLLPDSAAGETITVDVRSPDGLTGSAMTSAAKGKTTPLTVPLEGMSGMRNDTCASAVDLGGGGAYLGSTSGYSDDATGSCGGGGAPDAVAHLSLSSWSRVSVDTAGSAFDTVIYLRRACADPASEPDGNPQCAGAPALACDDDDGALTTSRLVECALPPGDWYVWVDGKNGASGDYTLTAEVTPVALDSCPNAGEIPPAGGSVQATVAPGPSHFQNGGAGTCNSDTGAGSPEAVFFVIVPSGKHTLDISTAGSSFKNSVYLRAGDCNAPDVACNIGAGTNPSHINTIVNSGGVYYVIVDGVGGASGTVSLTYAIQ